MKSIDDALELRGRIFGAFELAELGATRGENVDHLLTFVVVGAGPTGVEMAGQIAELAHRTLKPRLPPRSTPTTPGSSWSTPPARCCRRSAPSSARWTAKELEKLGVEVMLGAMVTDVDERGLEVKDKDGRVERIDAVTKVWAAGVQASPLGADRWPSRPAPRSTAPAGSASTPTSPCRATPRSSSSAT